MMDFPNDSACNTTEISKVQSVENSPSSTMIRKNGVFFFLFFNKNIIHEFKALIFETGFYFFIFHKCFRPVSDQLIFI